jgi:lipoprotein
MKRSWITGLVISVGLLASGCAYSAVPENANVAVNIADGSVTSQENSSLTQETSSNESNEPSEVPLLTIDREHTLQVNGEAIDIICTYGISGSRKDDYLFLAPSFVQLSVKLKSDNTRYKVKVGGLHSDVATKSRYSEYNGIIQDSLDLRYNDSPYGGYTIDSLNSYENLFLVEGVLESQSFMSAWYGYFYNNSYHNDGKKLSENSIRYYCDGAISRTVWNIVIDDTETGSSYSNYIADSIFMKCK